MLFSVSSIQFLSSETLLYWSKLLCNKNYYSFFTLFFFFGYTGFLSDSYGKESACNAGDLGSFPGWEDPLEKEMATHSSVLAQSIPWTEAPGRLQSIGSQRIGHHLATNMCSNNVQGLLDLFPDQGIKPVPPAAEGWSPNYWTPKEFLPAFLNS